MIALAVYILQFMVGSMTVVGPLYPPNAVMGGTVVAELHFHKGTVKNLTVLSGEEPFASSSRSALRQWRLSPENSSRELVILQFRQPHLQFIESPKEEIQPVRSSTELPYPRFVIQPSYPANSQGEGSVILQAEISTEGKVTDVEVVKSLGSLTDAGIDAVKQWEFSPARDQKGRTAPSQVYVVLIFRSPLI